MLLLAGGATVVDRPDTGEVVAVTVDAVTNADPGSGDVTSDGGSVAGEDGSTPADPAPAGVSTTTGSPAPGASGAPTGSSGSSTGSAAAPSGGASASPAPGGSSTGGGSGTVGGQGSGGGTTQAPSKPVYPEAALYDDTQKVRGFTDTEIVMCGHAALALGAAFDTAREDLNLYWDMVNEQGGIHGRKVTMTWEDDAYVSNVAVQAATSCADKNPFMILGGIGFDQIPGVRVWAEENKELYFHHIAVAPEKTFNYSYSLQPTVELMGEEAGHYIVRKHRERKTGVMFRSTPNWQPGSDAATVVMKDAGMDVASYPVFQNQGSYANEINQMQLAGTEVVFLWENALAAANIINQASEQNFYPIWVVFPFQQTIDLLTEPLAHTIEGAATWNAYAPGGYGGAFAEYGVDAEIARFEAASRKYRPGTTPNDILWMVWMGNKTLHRMLLDCGADCNRNRFAGMMLSGYQAQELPGCKINFADPRSFGGHHGGFAFFSQRMIKHSTGPRYETTEYCRKTLR